MSTFFDSLRAAMESYELIGFSMILSVFVFLFLFSDYDLYKSGKELLWFSAITYGSSYIIYIFSDIVLDRNLSPNIFLSAPSVVLVAYYFVNTYEGKIQGVESLFAKWKRQGLSWTVFVITILISMYGSISCESIRIQKNVEGIDTDITSVINYLERCYPDSIVLASDDFEMDVAKVTNNIRFVSEPINTAPLIGDSELNYLQYHIQEMEKIDQYIDIAIAFGADLLVLSAGDRLLEKDDTEWRNRITERGAMICFDIGDYCVFDLSQIPCLYTYETRSTNTIELTLAHATEYQEASFAVWPMNQFDALIWYAGISDGNGNFKVTISGDGMLDVMYNIHVYAVKDGENRLVVGTTRRW